MNNETSYHFSLLKDYAYSKNSITKYNGEITQPMKHFLKRWQFLVGVHNLSLRHSQTHTHTDTHRHTHIHTHKHTQALTQTHNHTQNSPHSVAGMSRVIKPPPVGYLWYLFICLTKFNPPPLLTLRVFYFVLGFLLCV